MYWSMGMCMARRSEMHLLLPPINTKHQIRRSEQTDGPEVSIFIYHGVRGDQGEGRGMIMTGKTFQNARRLSQVFCLFLRRLIRRARAGVS